MSHSDLATYIHIPPTITLHQTVSRMLTNLQKVKILQNLLCLVSVNYVYGSGESHGKEGKERKVFGIFEAELALFLEKKGRWAAMSEFTGGSFTSEALRQSTKANVLSSEKIWERGMLMRRELVSWLADYGKILNFTTLRPLVDEEGGADIGRENFLLELNEDSGGNADSELQKILQKVLFPNLPRR